MCILDLSKTLMYHFHYNYTKERYVKKAGLLSAVTDSLVYEIETNNVSEEFYKDKDIFDFSKYLDNSKFYHAKIKKVIDKMKDETKSVPITEF